MPSGELDLAATLSSGQVFRWTQDESGAWRGMVGARRMRLWQTHDGQNLWWEADGETAGDAQAAVNSFLRLDDANLIRLAAEWSRADVGFSEAWERQPGVRVLRQDPDECFFSFLCASVAPIARIGAMLRAVARECGTDFGEGYTAFPGASALCRIKESRLRDLGLGFRAKRVAEAARRLAELPPDHLRALRFNATHGEARRELCAFFGVGEKIADCVCLFSLDKDGAIPVDTHIWRIARTRYLPELSGASLTPANYARVTHAFHERFGSRAGWAQQTLFYRAAVAREK